MNVADDSTEHESDQSTRDRLLDAAIDIAGETGVQAVTYRAVAARVGMAHGLVRHHFGTREQLLIEAFRRAATQDSDEVGLEANSIDEFASNLVPTLNTSRKRQLLQYDETTQAVRGNLPIENVRGLYRRYAAQVRNTLDNAGVPDPDGSISELVFSALDGLVMQHMVFSDDARTSQLLEQLREVLRRLATSRSISD
ncbi:TetR/AcrR family transcriptional regulator [Rhodococcus sp. P1Y]|uniref:TetR/AcrR family transcriptional regulator n=1 Tax=Rhodococcus sp. P1Y TaxID=1302308 RepID=UPI000EB4B9C3|nr:TetR/AcrR family transcriptional regulator [Rhodococcus sp. P1Y]AYJ48913.1 TetR/AcrR family transcriptional regulator [Rhodococcus sp. P1Y]